MHKINSKTFQMLGIQNVYGQTISLVGMNHQTKNSVQLVLIDGDR